MLIFDPDRDPDILRAKRRIPYYSVGKTNLELFDSKPSSSTKNDSFLCLRHLTLLYLDFPDQLDPKLPPPLFASNDSNMVPHLYKVRERESNLLHEEQAEHGHGGDGQPRGRGERHQVKSYYGAREMNRFMTQEQASKNRIIRPSKVRSFEIRS